jgi:hypothetical protein
VPGWVIKFLRITGEKIFINLCEHAEVPSTPINLRYSVMLKCFCYLMIVSTLSSSNNWPFIVLSPGRNVSDTNGEFLVYDAIISSQSYETCISDPIAKDTVSVKMILTIFYLVGIS